MKNYQLCTVALFISHYEKSLNCTFGNRFLVPTVRVSIILLMIQCTEFKTKRLSERQIQGRP